MKLFASHKVQKWHSKDYKKLCLLFKKELGIITSGKLSRVYLDLQS